MLGPIGNNFSRPRFPVNLHQGISIYLYVLDKPRVDPLRRGAQLGAISPIGLRPALYTRYIAANRKERTGFLSRYLNGLLTYVCIYVCVCMYVCKYLRIPSLFTSYVCIYVCILCILYICMYVCVCVYVCMYVCICMYVRMYVCIYVCKHVCMYASTVKRDIHTVIELHWRLSNGNEGNYWLRAL